MNETKLYRAATLRKALEQVKQELGEDALILKHKRVRVGGFMGIGSRELVEVYASADVRAAEAKRNNKAPERAKSGKSNAAAPTAQPAQKPVPSFAAFATRAYNEASGNRAAPAQSNPPAARHSTPTFLQAKELNSAANSETSLTRSNSVAGELNRLRSEFRELKFSLGLMQRPVAQTARLQGAATEFEDHPEIYDTPYYETYLEMIQTGLAPEQARHVMQIIIRNGGNNLSVEAALSNLLRSTLRFVDDEFNVISNKPAAPFATVFIGPTGVGKTTTIAKLAAYLVLRKRQRVELITLDSYRIAAVEQLKRYAEVIGAGCHAARSVVELDALTRRYAGTATMLVDTAGRNPHDLADQMELADYLRGATDLNKCLVLQATTHPADALIAARKFALYGSDQLVITKLDETTRPGAVVSTVSDASLPLAYICAGQRVPEDLERATPTTLAARVLRATLLAAAAA